MPRRPPWRPSGWEPLPEGEGIARNQGDKIWAEARKNAAARRARNRDQAYSPKRLQQEVERMFQDPKHVEDRRLKGHIPDPRFMPDDMLIQLAATLSIMAKYDWRGSVARPEQLRPEGEWDIWLLLAGRGFGKTRCAAEDAREVAMANPGCKIAVIAKDHRALRDVCFEGESGLRAVIPPEEYDPANGGEYKKGLGDVSLTLRNGSKFIGYTSAEPDAIRGQSFILIWGDEFAAWPKNRAMDMIDQAMFCLRSAEEAKCVLTTTPKRVKHVLDMVRPPKGSAMEGFNIAITYGKTSDNTALSKKALEMYERRYAGTRIGRQELGGELLADVEGVLWTQAMVEAARWEDLEDAKGEPLPRPLMVGKITGVDPSGSATGDATGIVTVGWDVNKTIYVLEDRSCQGSPAERFTAACMSAYENGSFEIWVESAFSGDQARFGVEQQWKNLQQSGEIPADKACPPVKASTLKGDKAERAMSVVALYEQQVHWETFIGTNHRPRIWHMPNEGYDLTRLEDEQLTWSPRPEPGQPKPKSPNAIDAEVHAVRHAMKKLGLEASVASPARKKNAKRIDNGFQPGAGRLG